MSVVNNEACVRTGYGGKVLMAERGQMSKKQHAVGQRSGQIRRIGEGEFKMLFWSDPQRPKLS